jgi:hypothetical protein
LAQTNPFGVRALYVGKTAHRIHGTNISPRRSAPSFPRDASGARQDVIELYGRVSCGAWPPGGGIFHFQILVMPPLAKTCPKAVSSPEGVSLSVKVVLQKNFQVRESISLVAPRPLLSRAWRLKAPAAGPGADGHRFA